MNWDATPSVGSLYEYSDPNFLILAEKTLLAVLCHT